MSVLPKMIIADSHEIVREGISSRLREDCGLEIVAGTSDGYSTIKACRQSNPDILLMDLSLTRPKGSETLTKIRESNPKTNIIVISSDATIANAFLALSQGAVGFMPKQASGQDFVNAINAVRRGYTYLPMKFVSEFVRSRRNINRTGNIFGLSPREIEVLEFCVLGQSTKEVAEQLHISTRTVETHRNSIYKKSACKNLSELSKILKGT
ncbi:response regulator transcription factor [uncultured Roseobacter sp.]|uniref:response regulator transcription factor n=1 Tax=uncultured Roseobacter sp. TaxID=114847 RepID=UPI00261644D2|nr:response regulator transcription factor [uncultured Roseobacter sp.]